MDDLKGKVVLITGASTGIGAATALAFGEQGARVAVHYNASKTQAERVCAEIRAAGGEAAPVQGDVTQPGVPEAVVAATIAGFGRIDVLINNAGGLVRRTRIADYSDEFVLTVLQLNILQVCAFMRVAVPQMRAQGAGCIVNVSSVAARTGGAHRLGALCGGEGVHLDGDAQLGQGAFGGSDPRQRHRTGRDPDTVP